MATASEAIASAATGNASGKEQLDKIVGKIKNTKDLADLMTATITGVVDGTLPTEKASVICNATGRLLKIAELSHRYGHNPNPNPQPQPVVLIGS